MVAACGTPLPRRLPAPGARSPSPPGLRAAEGGVSLQAERDGACAFLGRGVIGWREWDPDVRPPPSVPWGGCVPGGYRGVPLSLARPDAGLAIQRDTLP